MLGAVFVLLAIMLAPTLRAYLTQRDEQAALAGKVARQEQTVEDLRRSLAQWDDPAHVEAQARARLKLVRPGETPYQVVGGASLDGTPGQTHAAVVAPAPSAAHSPWYGQVWSSLTLTDGLSRGGASVATSPIAPADGPGPTDPSR